MGFGFCMSRAPRLKVSLLGALVCALTLGACAQEVVLRSTPAMTATFTDGRFVVEWGTAQTQKHEPLVAGYVTNKAGGGVNNVRMLVEALDAQGQVIDTATALVPNYVGGFDRSYFEVPLRKPGVGYRVTVLGWDPAGSGQ